VKIRVLTGFGAYEPGQVFEDWPAGMCELFIQRGMIEEVKEPEPVEVAEQAAEVETADIHRRRKK